MSGIRILVVEDDENIAETLSDMLDMLGHQVVEVVNSVDAALDALNSKEVDLALVDIQLSGHKSGIDLAKELTMYHNIPYVFTSAFADSDIIKEASEQNPYGYLVKPYGRKDINAAIEVALSNFKKKAGSPREVSGGGTKETGLFVRVDSKLVRLNYDDILFVEAKGDYIIFRTESGDYIVHSTIKNLENYLDPSRFIKVHRSYIVNIEKVVDIDDSNLVINDKIIPVSRRQRAHLLSNIKLLR